MTEVEKMIAADRTTATDLRDAVARTNRKLRGVMKIVELLRRRDAEAVCKDMLDRHERLRELCRSASTHAELVRDDLDGPRVCPAGRAPEKDQTTPG